jgi:cysteine synthase B
MGTTGTIIGTKLFKRKKESSQAQPSDGSQIPGIRKWEYLPFDAVDRIIGFRRRSQSHDQTFGEGILRE